MAKNKKATPAVEVEVNEAPAVEVKKKVETTRIYTVRRDLAGYTQKGQAQKVIAGFNKVLAEAPDQPVKAKDVALQVMIDDPTYPGLKSRHQGKGLESVLWHLHIIARFGFLDEKDIVEYSDGTTEVKSTKVKEIVAA